jgi:ABC-type oligopeptide transport system ATPase subunit
LKQELSTFSGRRSRGQVIEREDANTALVDHTSFSIPRGKTLGVVGESC